MQNDLIRRTKRTVLERWVSGKRRGSVEIGSRWVLERTVSVLDGAVVDFGERLKCFYFMFQLFLLRFYPPNCYAVVLKFNRRGAEQRLEEAVA